MRKITKQLIIGLFATASLASCDSFLDETPDNRLRLDSYEKIAELLVSAYPSASNVFMEFMSDNVGPDPKNIQKSDYTQAYCFEKIDMEGQDTPSYYWGANYMAIAHANQALLALEKMEENNPGLKKAIRGEALACRAYAHFMLVNTFAKPYDETTANTDQGIVIMTQPEVTLLAQYKRNTVKEVYDFIEKDLLEAVGLVSNQYYKNTGKYHFNEAAVRALASRFFLFKKDYEKAEKYATELLGDDYNAQMIRDYSQIYTGTAAEVIARKFSDPNLTANLLLVRKDVYYGYKPQYGYRFTEAVYQQMVLSSQDIRFSVAYNFGGATTFLPKFQRTLFQRTSITAATGYPYTIAVELRSEEVFFNRLEAWLMMGADKLSLFENQFSKYLTTMYGGSTDYNALFKSYKQNHSTLTDQEIRLKMLLDEKRREFVEEGLRWLDIRRHDLPVTHVDINGVTHRLNGKDSRKVLQIPETAIKYGNLEPNSYDDAGQNAQQVILNKK
ncbi:MAG: RagB/SusD family nutrient uptake outer membrane protein [Bacteroidia bacterium]|nr:RagB/SusD family nutrient uptake outer membrane protein [Bacteroidia bacterium]